MPINLTPSAGHSSASLRAWIRNASVSCKLIICSQHFRTCFLHYIASLRIKLAGSNLYEITNHTTVSKVKAGPTQRRSRFDYSLILDSKQLNQPASTLTTGLSFIVNPFQCSMMISES